MRPAADNYLDKGVHSIWGLFLRDGDISCTFILMEEKKKKKEKKRNLGPEDRL